VKDGTVTVTTVLFRGEEEVATFTTAGPEMDVDRLAASIVEQTRSRVPR
jgi:hypothetical protein